MTVQQILTIISTIASFLLLTLIPSVIMLVQKWKAFKNAKTNEERQAILNDINNATIGFIQNAEETFKSVDTVLKAQGSKGCGSVKKENVLTKIQSLCLQKGIEYDEKYWSEKVEELVALTKQVNAKE